MPSLRSIRAPRAPWVRRVRRVRRAGERRGFTILELLITLVVLSIAAAIVVPAFFARPEVTLENASILLAHDLRTAQNRSAYMSEVSAFRFPEGGDGYRVTNQQGEIVQNPATGLEFVRSYSEDAVFDGVRVEEVDCGGDRVLLYDEGGRATEGATITLSYNGEKRRIEVKKGSGRVTIVGSTSGFVDRGY